MILLEVTPLTYDDKIALFTLAIILIIHFCLRALKDTKLGFLYRGWRLFWFVLFAYIFANYAKDKIKKWWNS